MGALFVVFVLSIVLTSIVGAFLSTKIKGVGDKRFSFATDPFEPCFFRVGRLFFVNQAADLLFHLGTVEIAAADRAVTHHAIPGTVYPLLSPSRPSRTRGQVLSGDQGVRALELIRDSPRLTT